MSTKAKWLHGRMYYYDSARPMELWPADPEMFLYDDFLGVDTTDIVGRTTGYLGTAPGTADAVTLSTTASVSGAAKVLSGTADNDHAFLSSEISFYGKFDACFETRLCIDSAAAVGMMIGFTDTTGIANAGAMSLSVVTWTTTSVEGAAFVYDTDATTDTLRCMAVKTNVDATTPVDTSLVPVAGTYYVYAVHLLDNGTTTDAYFYVDGVQVGTISGALLRTTALTPFVSMGTRTGAAAKYALVDYCKAWQRRA